MAWAVATVEFQASPLIKAIAAESQAKVSVLHCQDLANTAWSFARMSVLFEPLMRSIAEAAIAKIEELDALGLSNMLWAFAKLELSYRPLIDAIAMASLKGISAFSAQNLANLSWSLAKLSIVDRPLLEAIAVQVAARVQEFTAFDLSILVWALDVLNLNDLLEGILPLALEYFNKDVELDGDVGMFWFDVANVASIHASPEIRATFEAKFHHQLFKPVHYCLEALASSSSSPPDAMKRWDAVVEKWNIPYLGPEYTRTALTGIGVQMRS